MDKRITASILGAIFVVSIASLLSQISYQDIFPSISENMISSQGLTIVKVTGESSTKISQDQSTIVVNIMTKPTDLNSLEKERKAQIDKVIDAIQNSLGADKVEILPGYTYYNSQWYGSSPDMSSVSAHVEIPIKIEIENIASVSKIVSEQGFWINNLQIQKVPKSSIIGNKVSISQGSSIPDCENTTSCFVPYNKVVNVGQTISWENLDSAAHTVTSGKSIDGHNGMFDSGLFSPGSSFEFVFDSVGEYDYFCMVHPWMEGTVTVVEGDSSQSEQPVEYVYQASLTAIIDLPPDTIDNSISKYQEKLDAINNALSSYQLEDKSTRQGTVSFNPTYWPSSISNIFTAQTQLIIKVDYENSDLVLKTIKESGANFESFFLSYSPDAIESVRQDLTQKAIENAKERALEIISPMGLQIKGIKSIEVNSSPYSNPYGNTPVFSQGVMLRVPYYDTNQVIEAFVSVNVEFEVGK